MSRVWVTVMEDNEGCLMALDRDGEVVVKAKRTKPPGAARSGDKWSEELVTNVHGIARLAMVLITRRDHEDSRF